MIIPGDNTSIWSYTPGSTSGGINTIDYNSNFSILGWVKAPTGVPTENQLLCEFQNSSGTWGVRVYSNFSNNDIQFRANGSSAALVTNTDWDFTGANSGSINNWHLIGLSFNGTSKLATLMCASETNNIVAWSTGTVAGAQDFGQQFQFVGGTSAAQKPWNKHGLLVARNHQMTTGEFQSVFNAGYTAPLTYTGGNFSDIDDVKFSIGHALLGSPLAGPGQSVNPIEALPGDNITATNLIVLDRNRDDDMRNVWDDCGVAGTTSTFQDPFDESYFTETDASTLAENLPVSAYADALSKLYTSSPSRNHFIISHGNSRVTRMNVDDYYGTDNGQCIPAGLSTYLNQVRGSQLLGCIVPAVSFSTFACWPWVQTANPYKSGTVHTIGDGAGTYEDFARIGCGNNNAAGSGPGQHVHIASSSVYQTCFDPITYCDYDRTTDALVVFAIVPKYPGGGSMTVEATTTSAINSNGSLISGLSTVVDQDNKRTVATVKSWDSSGKTLTLDEPITVSQADLIYVTSGSGEGTLFQSSSNGILSTDTIISTTHVANTDPVLNDTVAVGPIGWEVVSHTIPADTLGESDLVGLRFTTDGDNAGIISYVGCYVSNKNGFSPVAFGHSGHGFGPQYDDSFIINNSDGYNQYTLLLKTITDIVPNTRHALCLHTAAQNSTTDDLDVWTDMVQAKKPNNLDIAWLFEGTSPNDQGTFADDTDGSTYGSYGGTNAASQGVSCVASQITNGLPNGISQMMKGYYANGGSHFSTLGNVKLWETWLSAGTAWQTVPDRSVKFTLYPPHSIIKQNNKMIRR